ncbi:PQQ-binding-like beta-propeller repeat protein [Streptomyces sp. NPDC053048]|uniref:outer membrane protein assembly factor BamB family protein n=1 Tax=Streptomyces sp. NPDC053048 TaxID=3365694 RepID=UPI0037D74107
MNSMDSADRRRAVRRRLRMASAVVGVLCAVAACGGGASSEGGRATGANVPPESFPDSPTTSFQGAWPSPLGDIGPADVVALGAHLAFAYDRKDVGVTAFRLDSGEVAWHTAAPAGGTVAQAPPRLAGNAVIGAFAVTEEGTGTYADRHGVTVVALDAGTGRTLWTREIGGEFANPAAAPHVVGADPRHVLVASYEQGYEETPPSSVLLDTRTGRIIWTEADFKGVDLEQSVAVGIRSDDSFAGKSVADNIQLWKRDLPFGESEAADPGPGLTWIDGTAADEPLLIDPTTGATRLDSGDTQLEKCHYDGWTTTICAGTDESAHPAVWAVDVRTARVLWRLPDESANRVAPRITSAWHGAVYAQADQAMTLDARTGRDLRTDLGLVSPAMVNDHYGLVYDDTSHSIDVYRAPDAFVSG